MNIQITSEEYLTIQLALADRVRAIQPFVDSVPYYQDEFQKVVDLQDRLSSEFAVFLVNSL